MLALDHGVQISDQMHWVEIGINLNDFKIWFSLLETHLSNSTVYGLEFSSDKLNSETYYLFWQKVLALL